MSRFAAGERVLNGTGEFTVLERVVTTTGIRYAVQPENERAYETVANLSRYPGFVLDDGRFSLRGKSLSPANGNHAGRA